MDRSLKTPFPAKPQGKHANPAVVIVCVLAITIVISICIPLISQKRVSQSAPVYHSRLFPFYYQTNTDAQSELLSSLGFPGYYKTCGLRTDRPLIIGIAAGIRGAVVSVLRLLAPGSVRVLWGDYSALSVVLTYCAWIFVNILFIGLAAIACFRAFAPLIGRNEGVIAALLLCTAPIVILSIREIAEGSAQVLLAAASLLFWQRVLTEKVSLRHVAMWSAIIGILLLGKLAITTFASGCFICLFTPQRKLLGLIVPIVALPMLLWMGFCGMIGIPFSMAEVFANAPALRGAASLSFVHRLAAFPTPWASMLAESGLMVQLPFALIGLYWFAKHRRINVSPP